MTHPGIEINVTPLNEAPIIPKATKNQGDFLFPLKNVSLSLFFEVNNEIKINTRKYVIIVANITIAFKLSPIYLTLLFIKIPYFFVNLLI